MKYSPDKNKTYLFDAALLKDHASSNHPFLCDKDVVIIDGVDFGIGRRANYWEKHKVPCYVVRLVKPLCKVKRANKDSGAIGEVPEICLIPYQL